MASDIPETHSDPVAMARCLASYIDNPDKIFRRVKAEFGTSPCHETISAMRARHLQPAYISEPAKPYDGYYPGDAAASLETTNTLFLARLKSERDLSASKALASTYLTQPALVNRQWNKVLAA